MIATSLLDYNLGLNIIVARGGIVSVIEYGLS
jgi:hypothetical protein